MENRLKTFELKAEDMWGAVSDCKQLTTVRGAFLQAGTPKDAQLQSVRFDAEKNTVLYTLSHSSFPPISEGKEIPVIVLLGDKNEPAQ